VRRRERGEEALRAVETLGPIAELTGTSRVRIGGEKPVWSVGLAALHGILGARDTPKNWFKSRIRAWSLRENVDYIEIDGGVRMTVRAAWLCTELSRSPGAERARKAVHLLYGVVTWGRPKDPPDLPVDARTVHRLSGTDAPYGRWCFSELLAGFGARIAAGEGARGYVTPDGTFHRSNGPDPLGRRSVEFRLSSGLAASVLEACESPDTAAAA
jgi:hypothetical protein